MADNKKPSKNPVRWQVLRMLATEGPQSVTVLAARTPTGRNIP